MSGKIASRIARLAPAVVVFVVIARGLEVYLRAAHVPRYMMPLPSEIARALLTHRDELAAALGWTALAAVGGFCASAIVGVQAALLLSSSRLVRRAIYPYTVFFQTVPIVAIAPMLIFWIGSGPLPVAVCAFIVSVFPVIANTLSGLLSTDPALLDLFRLYGSRPIETLWKLRLPAALPSLFTGLRVAAGLAVIGAVVAEFLVGQIVDRVGLGVLIVEGIHEAHLDVAFAAVLLASLLGLGLFGAINLISNLALRNWHASERN